MCVATSLLQQYNGSAKKNNSREIKREPQLASHKHSDGEPCAARVDAVISPTPAAHRDSVDGLLLDNRGVDYRGGCCGLLAWNAAFHALRELYPAARERNRDRSLVLWAGSDLRANGRPELEYRGVRRNHSIKEWALSDAGSL